MRDVVVRVIARTKVGGLLISFHPFYSRVKGWALCVAVGLNMRFMEVFMS